MYPPRKQRKSYDIEGHAHELTFSCYYRRPFLDDDPTRKLFLWNLDRAQRSGI